MNLAMGSGARGGMAQEPYVSSDALRAFGWIDR
jgi:hypothetical protein